MAHGETHGEKKSVRACGYREWVPRRGGTRLASSSTDGGAIPHPAQRKARGGSIWAIQELIAQPGAASPSPLVAHSPALPYSDLGLDRERRRRGTYHRATGVRVVLSVPFTARAADGSVRTGAAWAHE